MSAFSLLDEKGNRRAILLSADTNTGIHSNILSGHHAVVHSVSLLAA
jgi:hypothetical protein